MKILWAITGAGHLLKESIKTLEKLSENNQITIVTSKAANEVLKLYGYTKNIEEIIEKNKENQLITDKQQQYSYPLSGKLTHNKYDIIIISPTTANTTAKIVHAIADTLITNIAAQSGKGEIPLIVVPVDQKQGHITTTIPPYIDKEKCKKCTPCPAQRSCPTNAIIPPEINTIKCISCKKCKETCPYHAINTDKQIKLYIRQIDAQNTKKLETIENITTLYKVEDIPKEIKRILG